MKMKNKVMHGTSMSEIKFYYYIKKIFPQAIHRYKFVKELNFEQKLSKSFEIDIYIPDLKIGIEYDGVFYHKKSITQKRDKIKGELLKSKNIKLIRIREVGLKIISENNFFYNSNKESFKKCIISIFNFIKKECKLNNDIINSIDKLKNHTFDDDIELIRNFHNKIKLNNSLLIKKPKLANQWHPYKNNNLKPEHVTIGSTVNVWWVCENNHEWLIDVNSRNKGFGCPYCSNQKACEDNCLKTINPKLAKEWSYKKNKLTPEDVVPGSNIKVWWICENNHEWKSDINSRNKGSGCPYCSGHKLHKDNSLAAVNTELSKEWHPTKNDDKTPEYVFPNSRTDKAWWQCSKNKEHVWESKIRDRHQQKQGCPYCAGKKISKENSLANSAPELSKQWHPTKNGDLTPKSVTRSSGKMVWWQCSSCNHEWEAFVNNRVRSSGKCSNCKKK
jgi:hypothetical protein